MINYLILYGLLMGGWLLVYHHGRVVVPGLEGNLVRGLGLFVLRGWIFTAVILWGMADIPGAGYRLWWENYVIDHSMILWWAVTVPLTLGLWLVKSITFQVLKAPGRYNWWGDRSPCLHETNMWIPTAWYGVFWGWFLFSPTLPFYTCFIRGFLLKTPVNVLFPLG